jgi:hypothetical protein
MKRKRNMWPFGPGQALGRKTTYRRSRAPHVDTNETSYKGYRVWSTLAGVKTSADPDSTFDDLKQAKRFIDAQKRNPRKAMAKAGRKRAARAKRNPGMTTRQLRNILQTDRSLDERLVVRALGAMSGVWSSQNRSVDEWIAVARRSGAVKPDVVNFVEDVARMRGNPAAVAAEVYEEFHGTPSTEIVEVTKKVHYHKHLAALGKLEVLVVAGSDGYEHRLVGFKGAKLCANESKNQMFIEGGDQALNASEWRFKKGWPHEMNSLGLVTRIEYFTTKKHLGSEGGTAIYFHESGKAERGQSAGVGPDLIYDAPNEALLFAGGTYLIKAEGIDK